MTDHCMETSLTPIVTYTLSQSLKTKLNTASKLATVATLLVLVGCTSRLGDLPKEAEVTVPKKWEVTVLPARNAKPTQTDGVSDVAPDIKSEPEPEQEPEPVKNGWLSSFDDPELNQYVQIALDKNPDLWSSAVELKSAIEQVTVTGSSLWPNVQVGLSQNRTSIEGDSVSTQIPTSADGQSTSGSGVTTEIRTVSGSLDISWEADVWGKLTQRKRAAAYTAKAQGELFKAAELSLVANVSRAWFNLVTNKLQLDLAHQRLDSFKRTASLIEENYERGIRSALDVYLSRTDVQTQLSSLSESQFSYISSLRAFKTLLGQYPDTDLEFSSTLPLLQSSVSAGLPAELLTRRPDIKASQLQYKAQIANAKAANRDRYPSINFTGSIGDSRDSFNRLFENDSMIRTLISSISQPVFQAGALKSLEEQALYQAESAYASLVKTTLTAFEEVENSLSRETLLKEQHTAIKEAVTLAQGGLDLALDRYQSGIENYTTVLQSQRSLFDSRRNELNIRNALLQNRIGIHLALGGDFSEFENRDALADLPGVISKPGEIEETTNVSDLEQVDIETDIEQIGVKKAPADAAIDEATTIETNTISN